MVLSCRSGRRLVWLAHRQQVGDCWIVQWVFASAKLSVGPEHFLGYAGLEAFGMKVVERNPQESWVGESSIRRLVQFILEGDVRECSRLLRVGFGEVSRGQIHEHNGKSQEALPGKKLKKENKSH